LKINLDCVVERWEKEAEAELEAEDSSGSEESCRTERDSEMLIE
jgi:CRP-like cAMP-binding protein